MKKLIQVLFLAAVLGASVAHATKVTLSGLPTNSDGSYYTGFSNLTLADTTTIAALCDDFTHDVSLGSSWNADIAQLTLSSGAHWLEAAWLYSQLVGQTNSTIINNIQYAVWGLFASNAPSNGPATTTNTSLWWTAQAAANYTSLSAATVATFYTITPDPVLSSGAQGFMAQSVPTKFIEPPAAPEPVSALLTGIGVLALGAFQYKRRRRPSLFS